MNVPVRSARASGPGDARTAPPGRAFRPPRGAGAALGVARYCVPQGSGDSRTARSLSSHPPGPTARAAPGRVRPAVSGARP